jgi:RNA polymerase sigma factor (sigma-70 family)
MSAVRGAAGDAGERLAAQERRLLLLLAHLAGRAVRARVELDDLLQEVYLRALADPRGLPETEPAIEDGEGGEHPSEGPLWRVLAQHARHVVVDVARALRARKRGGEREPLRRSEWSRCSREAASQKPGPHTAAAAVESSRALARSFLDLSAEYRRVIGLRQFQGLSARETALRMGRSESAVHSLYRRALGAWQEDLGQNQVRRDESRPFLRLDPL